ncbi:hypothetical protein Ddc_16699 [Ditylenchus destructor]|nr:hypothetical protein Ddc_16699 [Ditylenchus destructor]
MIFGKREKKISVELRDIWLDILAFLKRIELDKCEIVCKRWHTFLEDNCRLLPLHRTSLVITWSGDNSYYPVKCFTWKYHVFEIERYESEEHRQLIRESGGLYPGPYKAVGWWNRGKSHQLLYSLRNSYVFLLWWIFKEKKLLSRSVIEKWRSSIGINVHFGDQSRVRVSGVSLETVFYIFERAVFKTPIGDFSHDCYSEHTPTPNYNTTVQNLLATPQAMLAWQQSFNIKHNDEDISPWLDIVFGMKARRNVYLVKLNFDLTPPYDLKSTKWVDKFIEQFQLLTSVDHIPEFVVIQVFGDSSRKYREFGFFSKYHILASLWEGRPAGLDPDVERNKQSKLAFFFENQLADTKLAVRVDSTTFKVSKTEGFTSLPHLLTTLKAEKTKTLVFI